MDNNRQSGKKIIDSQIKKILLPVWALQYSDTQKFYCMCTYFSGIHILVELGLNQVR